MIKLFCYFVIFIFQVALEAAYDPEMLFLTWQRSPETTMTVQWVTPPKQVEDLVEFQKEGDISWQKAVGSHYALPENVPFILHRIELVNLQPGTVYHFKIGSDGVELKFRTMPQDLKSPIRFAVGGDVYHDGIDLVIKTNKAVAKYHPMFVLIGGDIAYSEGLTFFRKNQENVHRWFDWLKAWKKEMITPEGLLIPLIPVIGNHEVKGGFNQTPKQAEMFYALFPMPGIQGCNVLDFQSHMSIFMLDSGHTHPIEAQKSWLSSTLRARDHIQHKFAFYHVPAYPCVRQFDKTNSGIKQHWVPLFEKHCLRAAFEHHDHAYKRTHPIRNEQIHPDGVIYLGDGAWGVSSARIPKPFERTWYLAKTAASRHFILIDLFNDHCQYWAISPEEQVIDHYIQFHSLVTN